MKSFVSPALAGFLCLPATYALTRWGGLASMLAALLVVIVMGAVGGAVSAAASRGNRRPGLLQLVLAFVTGSLVSETMGFLYYYVSYGYRDRYLGLGIYFAVLEFGGIAVFGGVATYVAALVLRRRDESGTARNRAGTKRRRS